MDYSRVIIYNNYVEVPQLCMAKKRSAHVLECLLNNARSRSTSTQTKVRVKRLFHVVLAPRHCAGATSPSRWSSSHSMCTASAFFLALLAELYPYPSMILQQLPELDQLWDWSYPDSGLVSWTEIPHLCLTLSQSFSVPGLSFLCLSTSSLSIGFVIWTLSPFLPVS